MQQWQVNSSNLPAGSSSGLSGITLEALAIQGQVPFRCRRAWCKRRGAQCKVAHCTFSGVLQLLGYSQSPRFSAVLPGVSIPFPFVSSQEQGLQCVRPSPNRSWDNMSFFGICCDFLAQKPSLGSCIACLLAPAEQGCARWEILLFAEDYCNISAWSMC